LSFFFFSSRRRHTRFSRDWSSDVCSSDLRQFRRHPAGRHAVVLVAAEEGAESVEAALEAGAHDYVLKPLDRRHFGIRLAIAEGQIGRASCRERVEIGGGAGWVGERRKESE